MSFGETIVPDNRLTSKESGNRSPRQGPDEVTLTSTLLGEGGMGRVTLAKQRSLDREVAVKTLRENRIDPLSIESLIRESKLTGRLEHPNIIPVHTLTDDENRLPMLIMKRIEGVSWAETFRDPALIPSRYTAGRDILETHLHILLEVCDALHFAHSKGIIHRDLKPDNVMLGAYGEVYVLDWGIAVSMNAEDKGILPLASEIDSVSGTPHYMAPELASGDPEKTGPRTDVYLLGALLHEILTGTPRHQGKTLMEILLKACKSDPVKYAPEVPTELGAIANRATAPEPDQRFESAEQFRRAVLSYLRHRDSYRITKNTVIRLRELEEKIKAPDDEDHSSKIYNLYSQCRFGFGQALEIWPENLAASQSQEQAITLMATYEIGQKDEKAAALLLEELKAAPPELLKALEELRKRLLVKESHLERLHRIEQAVDVNAASRERAVMALILGVLWGLVPALHSILVRTETVALDYPSYFVQFFGPTSLALIVVVVMRHRIIKNRVTFRIIKAIFVNLGANLLARVCCLLIGAPVTTAIAMENTIAAFCIALIATLIDRRLWPASLVFGTAALLVSLQPAFALEISAAANLLGLWTVALLWWLRSPLHESAAST